MKLFEKIKMYSDSLNESRTSLAREYGVTQQAISNYFHGKTSMPVDFLVWYIEKHPDIDLYALFNKSQENIVGEPKFVYKKKPNKNEILKKIIDILEEEL